MGLIKVAEISIDKLEDRKTVTAILHENGYTVGPGKRKKTETGKQLDYYLKVYVEAVSYTHLTLPTKLEV